MTGSENGEITTPMIGTSSPTRAFSARIAASTRCSPGAAATGGAPSRSMSAGRVITGAPASGGPSSENSDSPPQASNSIDAWKNG